MNAIKMIVIMMLILSLFQPICAEKRVKPKSMKELTDPSSPSYVPHPFPKHRKELIEDLKYAIKLLIAEGEANVIGDGDQSLDGVLIQLLAEESKYKIAEIVKVKNRAHTMAHDYTWLFIIRGENGEVVARVSMRANGLFGGAMYTAGAAMQYKKLYPNSRSGPHIFVKELEVLDCLSEALGRRVDEREIKKMERVAFQSSLGALRFPMWEIKLKAGKTFYYSEKRDSIYEIEDKKSWKKANNDSRKQIRSLVFHTNNILPDTINDEIIVLKKSKKKK